MIGEWRVYFDRRGVKRGLVSVYWGKSQQTDIILGSCLCGVWLASSEKIVFSEVLRKLDVCEV